METKPALIPFSRSNISAFEERFNRLRKEMDQMREERTRLTVALDFSKDERNLLIKQLKEFEDKAGNICRKEKIYLQI